uniref:Uncharacterized protein n=1 Tax=Anopheles atroparvus TaxID=41427 RepID=A0AAG5DLU3_ANOAO
SHYYHLWKKHNTGNAEAGKAGSVSGASYSVHAGIAATLSLLVVLAVGPAVFALISVPAPTNSCRFWYAMSSEKKRCRNLNVGRCFGLYCQQLRITSNTLSGQASGWASRWPDSIIAIISAPIRSA